MLERMWKQQELNCWLKCKLVQPLWKTVCDNMDIFSPYHPVFMLLGIYLSKGIENMKTYTWVFVSAVYDCPPWKQSNSPSVYEWISKLWNIQTVECYLALTINEPSSHEKTWRNLVCIFLSERSHSEKATYSVTLMIWHSEKRHNQRSVVTRD